MQIEELGYRLKDFDDIDVGSAPTSKQALVEFIVNAAKALPVSPRKSANPADKKASDKPRAICYKKKADDQILLCFAYNGLHNGGWVSSNDIWKTLDTIQKEMANTDLMDREALNARLTKLEAAAFLELGTGGAYRLGKLRAIARPFCHASQLCAPKQSRSCSSSACGAETDVAC